MAKCELTIHLEDEGTPYHGGDTVRGYVEVRVDEDVRCDGLVAECRWRTHGKGSSVHGEPLRLELFQGDWRAGALQRYPFELTLPHGPFTYHGRYLNVVWEVRAVADVPWALDPKVEREIVLAPVPDAEPRWVEFLGGEGTVRLLPPVLRTRILGEPDPTPGKASPLGLILGFGCLALFALPAVGLAIGAWVFVSRWLRGEGDPVEALLMVVMAVVFAIAFLGGGVRLVRRWIARKRLGQVTLKAEPVLLRAGGEVQVEIFCQPQKATTLNAAVARLEAEERVVRGSGTNRKTYRHTVYSEQTELALGRNLPAGLPFQVQAPVKIPPDAPPSFQAHRNELRWTLTVELDLASWPDWTEDRALVVHP